MALAQRTLANSREILIRYSPLLCQPGNSKRQAPPGLHRVTGEKRVSLEIRGGLPWSATPEEGRTSAGEISVASRKWARPELSPAEEKLSAPERGKFPFGRRRKLARHC